MYRFVVKANHLEDLVRLGTLTSSAARFLVASVVAGLNILVAGGTQAGNTAIPYDTRRLTGLRVWGRSRTSLRV